MNSFSSTIETCNIDKKLTLVSIGETHPDLLKVLSNCYNVNRQTDNSLKNLSAHGQRPIDLLILQTNQSQLHDDLRDNLSPLLNKGTPVLLVNPTAKHLGALSGIGFEGSEYVMLRKYNGYFVVEPLASKRTSEIIENFEMSLGITPSTNPSPLLYQQLTHRYLNNDRPPLPIEKTYSKSEGIFHKILRSSLKKDFPRINKLSTSNDASYLPDGQVFKGYLDVSGSGTLPADWWEPSTQHFDNAISFEYTYFASFNPYQKS